MQEIGTTDLKTRCSMVTKGIRGAITVDENSAEKIKEATMELFGELLKLNNLKEESVSHIIFTLTDDLNMAFPAKFVRENFGWNNAAMMCFHELDVPNSLRMCLRILVVVNCDTSFVPKFVYLKEASTLRSK